MYFSVLKRSTFDEATNFIGLCKNGNWHIKLRIASNLLVIFGVVIQSHFIATEKLMRIQSVDSQLSNIHAKLEIYLFIGSIFA